DRHGGRAGPARAHRALRPADGGGDRRLPRRGGLPPAAPVAPPLRRVHPRRGHRLRRPLPRLRHHGAGGRAVPLRRRPAPPSPGGAAVGRRGGARVGRVPALRRAGAAQAAGPAPGALRRGAVALRPRLERRRRGGDRRRRAPAAPRLRSSPPRLGRSPGHRRPV
ncbi:MAG: OrfL2, partial [uncultured Quadrisphaera sp.]